MRHVSAIFFQQVNAPPGQRTQLRLNGQNQDASYDVAGQLATLSDSACSHLPPLVANTGSA